MEQININSDKPVSEVISFDRFINIVNVPEPDEVIQERKFKRAVLKNVKEKIDVILQEKESEFEERLSQEKQIEYQSGFEEGKEQGRAEEHEQLSEIKAKLGESIKEVLDFKDNLIFEAEKTIIDLALRFAKTIVGQEIKSSKTVVKNQLKKALEYLSDESSLIIRINPDDAEQFIDKEKCIPEQYLSSVKIITDDSITRGGCVVETDLGVIDSTIESQTTELENAVKRGMEQNIESDTGQDRSEI
ncbi:FliH/SctL family protein [candidate division KSB1 bacterium]